jgi:tRNA (guanine26-N2/guanine27-N2)-dimethyltransferase
MELNRDATVLLVSCLNLKNYLDAMGATGVRGIRVASECKVPVTINDRDPKAVELIHRNAAHADLQIEVTGMNIHTLLSCRRFDAVDLDPYGSPAPFIDSAIRGTQRFLMVTATDTAPLCGAHKKAGVRRYFANPVNNEYHAETALRTLLGFVVRETVKYDRGIQPLFCFSREHFIRAHFRLTPGASQADRAVAHIGYIHQCTRCPHRFEQHGLLPEPASCSECGNMTVPIGPLWLGEITDPMVIFAMLERLPDTSLYTARELDILLKLLQEELPASQFYDYHVLAKKGKVSPKPIETVIISLREQGYQASRTHYSGTGIKTDASYHEILDLLRS